MQCASGSASAQAFLELLKYWVPSRVEQGIDRRMNRSIEDIVMRGKFLNSEVYDRSMHTTMEPERTTDPALQEVLLQLTSREPIFHRSEFGTTRGDFEKMMVADFWEVGASGRRYRREFVLDELEKRSQNPSVDIWKTSDFHCRKLAQDMYLLTYTLLQDGSRKTRRSTIWQLTHEGWKIVFHQGTIVQDA